MGKYAIRLTARPLHSTEFANPLKTLICAVRLGIPVSPIGCVKPLIRISIEADARTAPIMLLYVRPSVITVRVFPEVSSESHRTYVASLGNSLYYPPGVVRTGGAAYLVTECGDFTTKYYCCDEDGSRRCCNDPEKNLGLTVADDSYIASTPIGGVGSTPAGASQTDQPSSAQGPLHSSTTTVVPTTTVNAGNTASNQSNHHAVVIGAATGSSIAAVFIVIGIVGCIWLQRHPPKQHTPEDQEQGVQRAAVHEPNQPARVLDWVHGSLLGSHRDLPSTNQIQVPAHNAVEVNSPTIRRLTSFTHAPPSPVSISNADSHRRMPSADQVSSISIESPYIPYHPPPRTAAPPAAAELESKFDIAPIQVTNHSTSRAPTPAPLELEARDGVTITALWRAHNTSPDSPRGPARLGSPLSTMLQSSTTSPELAQPRAELPTENPGSAESNMNKAPTRDTSLRAVVQNPHPTTERKTRPVPTLEALKEGAPSQADERSEEIRPTDDGGHTAEKANMSDTSTLLSDTEPKKP